jgi:hypothetical protein
MALSHKAHQNGRPTKSGQIDIETKVRKYFEQGLSATVTAMKTGINIKTVCKYYNEWSDQIRESESDDFLERQKDHRNQIIVTFDEQIFLVNRQLDDIENQIKKYKNENRIIPGHLLGLRLDIVKFLCTLIEKKGLFVMQPTMDEGLANKIKEMLNGNGKARPSS